MLHAEPTSPVYHSRQLEAQALAKRRCCLDEDIFAFERGKNNFTLVWPKLKSADGVQ
jgi:hypothetical protein